MSPKIRYFTGMIFLVAAAVLAVLNLKRVADLGTYWVATPLMLIGIALIVSARRRK